MKINILGGLLCYILVIGFTACEQVKKVDKSKIKEGVSDLITMGDSDMPAATAVQKIANYNNMYGGVDAYQQIEGSINGNSSVVVVPRYFAISRTDFAGVLSNSSAETLYASLSTKLFKTEDGTDIYSSDLILHSITPGPQGKITLSSGEEFFDFALPCPMECPPKDTSVSMPPSTGISGTEAKSRIDNYNNIYGGAGAYRWIEGNIDGKASKIAIPRFFAIDRAAFVDILQSGKDVLFASLSTHLFESDEEVDLYSANLILHDLRPGEEGHVTTKTGNENFYDFAQACPYNCPE